MASSLALSIKPQVLMTTTSAPAGSSSRVCPASRHSAIICSVFTRFLAQPREIKDTFTFVTSCFVDLLPQLVEGGADILPAKAPAL